MRYLGRSFAAVAVVVLVLVLIFGGGSLLAVVLGLPGLLVGLLLTLLALQLGMLLGAFVFGARVHRVVIGVGGMLREWRTPRRTVILRGLPVLLSLSVGPGRSPVRLRLWLTSLVSAITGVLAVVTSWLLVGSSGSAFIVGCAVGATATLLHALVPQRDAGSTSTGWQLFGLPRLSRPEVAELTGAALADEALCAVNAGDLDAATAALDRLTTTHPDLRCTVTTKVTVLEAQGRYAEALAAVLQLVSDQRQTPRDMAFTCAGLASIGALAAESGEVPADVVLPIARQAVTDAAELGFPPHKLHGTNAVLALVDGEVDRAVTLARSAVSVADHALSRADDLATLARALMASGDNPAARTALTQAEAIAPWWPRVQSTRTRLTIP